jgi:hypothetical protein
MTGRAVLKLQVGMNAVAIEVLEEEVSEVVMSDET